MITEQSRLWVIDLDETTLNTRAVFNQITEVCESEGIIAASELDDVRQKTEDDGGSFDTFGHLSRVLGVDEDTLDTIADTIADNKTGVDFLYPDTREFLTTLDSLNEPWLTVTWGALRTQLPKLKATGLNERSYLITDIKRKGDLIQTWKTDRGYVVNDASGKELSAGSGMLIDDKPSSFGGLPEDWSGFLVRRREPRPSQQGTVPAQIETVKGLSEITQVLLRGTQ